MADCIRYSLRLPRELHQQLVHAAERARRSMNAQILRYIERGVAEDAEPERTERTERGFQPAPFRQERSGHWVPDV